MIQAVKRDGSVIQVGDDVRCLLYKKLLQEEFVVESITENPGGCESGFMVVVHLKSDPSKKIVGYKKEGRNFIDGIDANWFEKIS
ncbi:MAG TPA: hypothetical protein PKI55_12815 [Chitinophagaceae bacterium]|nr:hypothetical protein [Chitinophagaceae bacterium]